MTILTNHQGLTLVCSHDLYVFGWLFAVALLQIFQGPDMMDFDVLVRTTDLALIRLKPLDQLGPGLVEGEWAQVFDEDGRLSFQGNPAPMRFEGVLAGATVDHHLEDNKDFIADGDSGRERFDDGSSGGFMLRRSRTGQRSHASSI